MNTTSSRYVSYLRVSTDKQGIIGLGMQAQQGMIDQHLAKSAGTLVGTFTEVESGRKAARPQLIAAIAAAKAQGAVLLIATLDRLTRDTVFLAKLREANVDFVCCDMPEADRFTINIIAAVAEKEAEAISLRTKRAMAKLKARGEKLGSARNPGLYAASRTRGTSSNVEAAAAWKARLLDRCRSLRDGGRSLKSIAAELNQDGERTRRGAAITPTAVLRILDGQTGGHLGRF